MDTLLGAGFMFFGVTGIFIVIASALALNAGQVLACIGLALLGFVFLVIAAYCVKKVSE